MTEARELPEIIDLALDFLQARLHTATIGRVVAVGSKTIDVQPVINAQLDGESQKLPVFREVPPIFLGGGSAYTSYPIAVGDYALLIFTERCFDRWYSGEDEVLPSEFRMHDYSDGLALVGLRRASNAVTIPAETTTIGNRGIFGAYSHLGSYTLSGNMDAGSYSVGGTAGFSGSFTEHSGKTVTVVNGIITSVL